MLSKMQKLIVKDTVRISTEVGNAVANAIEELTRKELTDADCLAVLEQFLTTVEYRVDEIRRYSKNY